MKRILVVLLFLIPVFAVYGQNDYPTAKNTFMKLDGGGVTVVSPDKTGGWARGLRYYIYNELNDQTAGIGLYGSGDTIGRFYMAHGDAPHKSGKGMYILPNGNTGIGTYTPTEKLSVNGRIRAKEVKVETANWPDYVFEPDYSLAPLPELARFIHKNGHLPGMPKAAEVQREGVELGEMNRMLLEKIEELTLHIITQNEKMDAMNRRIHQLVQSLNL